MGSEMCIRDRVCTQDEDLRARFSGSPEKVVNLFSYIAEEVREILSLIHI